MKPTRTWLLALSLPIGLWTASPAYALSGTTERVHHSADAVAVVVGARQINPTTVEVLFADSTRMTLDFYGANLVRLFQDNSGGIIRNPEATPEAQILVDTPRKEVAPITLLDNPSELAVCTDRMQVVFNKQSGCFKLVRLSDQAVVAETVAPVEFSAQKVSIRLKENSDEYFYGGGVQNGRFSHKGKIISIVNSNSWTDGGVASPTPYYWSTAGYGVMWHTFAKGKYDFGATEANRVCIAHETNYLDAFFMVNDDLVGLLNDFYQLTGNPVLLPKFGFYEGHLNAYNRDYWKEDEKGILFEDGKRYIESQKNIEGIKESLNGEKNNYPFSARAVIDRYEAHDMPLGWLLPNDGYGAGYGQTATLDGNIQNLKSLTDYAHSKGVEIGLWTQSDLHPKEGVSALLQRDIVKEVRDAGVRVLKTDVAWVGAGYSFGLNGVADVAHIMPYYGNDARPFIISLDGWAGTQRYAGIWSGDQTGGNWEYIRFHIPTYIGSGLSGQPNISSDMDGIFGGKNTPVNVRDFQWKTFTPMQLNMDGWGANPKYPHILGEPAASINRWYLKMKSEIMPYAYSIAKEAVDGKPMIRAMFIDDPNPYTLGTATRYQFLYGPYFLVAPIYQATEADEQGNDIRNGIYLPEGEWVDYFTGHLYQGGRIINNYEAPLWKLPLFVKRGAIIPLNRPHNHPNQVDAAERIYEVYPYAQTSFTEYDDDGRTEAYRRGEGCTTLITQSLDADVATLRIEPTVGEFQGMVKEKSTVVRINLTSKPKKVMATVGGKRIKLTEVQSLDELNSTDNAFYYEQQPELNRFATAGSEMAQLHVVKNPLLHVRLAATDITRNEVSVAVKGYAYQVENKWLAQHGQLTAPTAAVAEEHITAYTLQPAWSKVEGADYYELEHNGMIYSTIKRNHLLLEDLRPETTYSMKLRAVNADGASEWTEFAATTKSDPLEWAIKGIVAETTCKNQGGEGVNRLFDFDESNLWHTAWGKKAVPFNLVMDLNSIGQVEKFIYLPRQNGGNGTLLNGTIYYSMDKKNWTEAGTFDWKGGDAKEFLFKEKPVMRFIKIAVSKAVGDFGSGRELYVFRVPGTESYIPGDLNLDGKVDENDLTSYMNYTGLRRGDGDFDGYISKGDLNLNGLIDAFDIAHVAVKLEDGIERSRRDSLAGEVTVTANKKVYNAGETIEIQVKGRGLHGVNALSFALPYKEQEMEYVGTEALGMKAMHNLTTDRLHTNGQKALYPTFVNLGDKETLEGDVDLLTIRFKAKSRLTLKLNVTDGLLVDRQLNTQDF